MSLRRRLRHRRRYGLWRDRAGWSLRAAAPTVGSTSIDLARASSTPSIPLADNVDAQIFFVARLPRVLAGGARRRDAGRGRRGAAGAAAQSAGHAVHARRLGRRGARRHAGDHVPAGRWRVGVSRPSPSPASPARSARVAIVYGLAASRQRGPVHRCAAAGRRHAQLASSRRSSSSCSTSPTSRRSFRTVRWLMGISMSAATARSWRAAAVHRRRPFAVFAVLPRALNLLTHGRGRGRGARASTWRARSAARSSARRSPPAPPCRWPARSASSASSCRTSCG